MTAGTWLLDLELGGRTLRYATRDVVAGDARGVAYAYRRGLTDFSMRLDGTERDQAVEVVDREVNWAEIAARGDGLERQRAVLRFLPSTTAFIEQARVVLDGFVEAPEYGDPQSPAALVLSIALPRDEAVYPPVSAVVDETTFVLDIDALGFPSFDDAINGAPYPTVFGYPGAGDTEAAESIGATPALMVDWESNVTGFLIIAIGKVDAETVHVWAPKQHVSSYWVPSLAPTVSIPFHQELPVIERTDALGQLYSAVEFAPTSDPQPAGDPKPWTPYAHPGEPYYIGWSAGAGRGGGALRPGGGPIRTLTDVAAFVLRHADQQVDTQAQESQGNLLDQYKIDGCLNERVELLPWFEGTIVPFFPIVRARTSRGIYFRFINWNATKTDAVRQLSTLTGEVTRASSIRSSANIANAFSIEYQLGMLGNFRKRATLSHSYLVTPLLGIDERVSVSPILARSVAKYGPIERRPVECLWTWSDTTVALILAYWAQRDALPRRFVEYSGPDLHTLSRGDIVTITDPEIALTEAVAIVDAVTLSSGRLHRVALEILDLQFRSTV